MTRLWFKGRLKSSDLASSSLRTPEGHSYDPLAGPLLTKCSCVLLTRGEEQQKRGLQLPWDLLQYSLLLLAPPVHPSPSISIFHLTL